MDGDKSRLLPGRPVRWIKPRSARGRSSVDGPTNRNELGKARSDILSSFLLIPTYLEEPRHGIHLFRMLLGPMDPAQNQDAQPELPDVLTPWLRRMREKNQSHNSQGTKQRSRKDSDCRRIYLPNPSAETMGILALNATKRQKPAVKGLILNYLAMETSFGLDSTQHRNFILEFQMPSFVWRTSSRPLSDTRMLNSGVSLRRSIDMSFLTSPCPNNDLLSEVQVSLLVTGSAVRGWTAYVLQDSYADHGPSQASMVSLDGLDHKKDCFDTIEDSTLSTYSHHPTQEGTKNPAEYFLLAVKHRLSVIARNYESIDQRLRECVYQYLDSSQPSSGNSLRRIESSDTKLDLSQGMNGVFLRRTSDISSRLTDILTRTVAMWDTFAADIDRLTYHESDVMSSRLMNIGWEINGSFVKMNKVLRNLKHLQSELLVDYPDIQESIEQSTSGRSLDRPQAPGSSRPIDHRNDERLQGLSRDGEEPMAHSDRTSAYSSTAFSRVFTDDPGSAKPTSFTQYEESTENSDQGNEDERPKTFYRYTAAGASSDTSDDEVVSLASSSAGELSKQDFNAESWNIRQAAASYIAEMLIIDKELVPLYQHAAERLEGGRFLRNHTRLLKSYHTHLLSQRPSQKQTVAINFLHNKIHRRLISNKIRWKMLQSQATRRERIHFKDAPNEDRNLTLERFLNNVDELGPPHTVALDGERTCTSHDEKEVNSEDWSEADESTDEEVVDKKSTVAATDLEATRNFFTSGAPLTRFKAEFRDFLFPGDNSGKELAETESRWCSWIRHCISVLFAWAFDKWYPPKPGHCRIRYTCVCGRDIFLDMKELRPGGIAQFCRRLSKSGHTNINGHRKIAAAADSPSPPPPVHLQSGIRRSSRSYQSTPTSGQETPASSGGRTSAPTSTTSWSENELSLPEPLSGPQYVLLCVKQKDLHALVHIECSTFKNDQYLFQEILQRYTTTREDSEWKPSSLLPTWIRVLLECSSKTLQSTLPNWALLYARRFCEIPKIRLYRMDTGDFVKFRLVPVREETVPRGFKRAEFPPCEQVESGNYIYAPVPMDEVELGFIPLHHLTLPGSHGDNTWLTMFPKKLHTPLDRRPGVGEVPVIGWGILVNEVFNWTHFLCLSVVVAVLIGVIVVTYWGVTSDASSAFGLGAYLVAIAALLISLDYSSWKDKLG